MNAMDFDDLLFRTVNLLELFEDVRERYTGAFRHVLVDEYQDTNHAQYRLLQLLVGGGRPPASQRVRGERPTYAGPVGHRNLAVVGDDSQSIYSFRGADVRNILDFQDDFPDARVVKLEQNYRSTETILAAANAVIANNRGGIAKRLWSELGQGDQIQLRPPRGRARRGALRRGRDPAAGGRGRLALGDRRPLPHQRHVPGHRGHPGASARSPTRSSAAPSSTSGRRSRTRSPICSCWPTPSMSSASPVLPTLPGAGIGQTSLARVTGHAAAIGCLGVGGGRRARADPGPGRRRRQGAQALHGRPWGVARSSAVRRGRPIAGCAEPLEAVLFSQTGYIEALEAERHDRGPGADREPRAVGGGGARVRRSAPRARGRLDVFLQEIALVADADTRSDDGGPRHPDDASQRQGP